MPNHPLPHASDSTSPNNSSTTTRRVSSRHHITATPGTWNTVVRESTPSSIYDNARQRTISTQRKNRTFSNRYRNDITVNNGVATILDMADGIEVTNATDGIPLESSQAPAPNVVAGTVLNTTAPIDEEDRTCYCDRDLNTISHPCAGSCGRSFHTCCVINAEFRNNWRCGKCQ